MALDLDQALAYKLSNTAAIQTICGTRIYPLDLPATVTLPAMTYQLISAPISATMDEAAGASLAHPRYQIDGWAGSVSGATALAAAVHTALHGFKGIITSGSSSLTVQSCLRVDKRHNKDPETGLYWVSQDFMIWAIE